MEETVKILRELKFEIYELEKEADYNYRKNIDTDRQEHFFIKREAIRSARRLVDEKIIKQLNK